MQDAPPNIRVMEAHNAQVMAAARLAQRRRLGAFLAFVVSLFRPLRSPNFAPTRFINRFAGLPSGSVVRLPAVPARASVGLAFTLKADATNVTEDDGMDYIQSYMPALLLEAEDDSGWAYLVCGTPTSADECEDPYCRPVTLSVNGAEVGKGNTDGLTHSVAALVAQASLPPGARAGEIIFSGAAAGCASDVLGIKLGSGDVLAATIEGLGVVAAQLS